jgi:hypothetical protein
LVAAAVAALVSAMEAYTISSVSAAPGAALVVAALTSVVAYALAALMAAV